MPEVQVTWLEDSPKLVARPQSHRLPLLTIVRVGAGVLVGSRTLGRADLLFSAGSELRRHGFSATTLPFFNT
jgi:hypothetical protein